LSFCYDHFYMISNHEESKSPIFYTRLVGMVEDKSIKDVMRDIDHANSHDHIKEVILTISSKGGWLYDGFALYDHIKASKKPIDIIAEGYCMSAAVMILQAGRKRISRPHTSFMVHPSNYSQEDRKPYSEFLSMVEEYKRMHDLFVKLTIGRSGMNKSSFEKLYEPRKYLSAENAKDLKLIDEILEK
jgi:ATP-dependent Clp protease, protease subunit